MTIIEPLLLIKPNIDVSSLLLAPHSSLLLETNYPHDHLVYRLLLLFLINIKFFSKLSNLCSIKEDNVRQTENEPLLKISPEGKLTTFARLGRAILTISNGGSEVWSKQHTIVSIEVY